MLNKNAAIPRLRWQRSKYPSLLRQMDVFLAAGRFILVLGFDKLRQNNSAKIQRLRARWLVKTILDLGPTFIKIGQSLSTRADILPLEYVEELATLQDNVPAFSSEQAVALIEAEFGKSIYVLYRDFEPVPIAAASLGQVHRARLHTGEEVVIKVQRPGLKQLFDVDVKAVHKVLRWVEWFFPAAKKYEIEKIYAEFFNILYQEIDYIKEGRNAERFRQNFLGYPGIIVPKVYWEYTSHKVLTVEYVPGIKVDDRPSLLALGLDLKKINQIGISCYLKQLLLDGFFQADPHPGNMAVSGDGRLIFYDFGMMAEVHGLAKDQMIKTFFAVLRKDSEQVLETLIAMGLIEPVQDQMPVKRLINFLLEKFTEKPVDFRAFNEIKVELYLMFEQQPFRLPAQMTFILKSLTTLDGIARILDPEYNLVALAQPFVQSLTYSKKGRINTVTEIVKQARQYIQYRFSQPSGQQVIKRLEQRLEAGELKIRVQALEAERNLRRINLGIKSLIYACLGGFAFVGGAVLFVGKYQSLALGVFVVAGLVLVLLIHSLVVLKIQESLDN